MTILFFSHYFSVIIYRRKFFFSSHRRALGTAFSQRDGAGAAAAEAAAEEGKFTFLLRICLRFILGLRYFTQGNLGTFSRIPFFVFSKFSNLTPPGHFLTLLFKMRCFRESDMVR